MNIQMARFTVKPNRISEFEDSVKTLISAVKRKRPKGVRYSLSRLSDGVTYLGLLELADGVSNPLAELPEGKQFLEHLSSWTDGPPTRDQLTAIGSYESL